MLSECIWFCFPYHLQTSNTLPVQCTPSPHHWFPKGHNVSLIVSPIIGEYVLRNSSDSRVWCHGYLLKKRKCYLAITSNILFEERVPPFQDRLWHVSRNFFITCMPASKLEASNWDSCMKEAKFNCRWNGTKTLGVRRLLMWWSCHDSGHAERRN